jgi:hypothetical protein
MKYKKFVEIQVKFLQKNPQAANFEAVYAIDPEGNAFIKVEWNPSLGNFSTDRPNDNRGDFLSKELLDRDEALGEDENKEDFPINAVCVN